MEKLKNALKSVRVRLFITLSFVILLIIVFLILVNIFVFGQFYMFSKTKALKEVYEIVNSYYNNTQNINLEEQLEKMAINNNFDILIKDNQNVNVYTSNKDFFYALGQINEIPNKPHEKEEVIIENGKNFKIKSITDTKNGIT